MTEPIKIFRGDDTDFIGNKVIEITLDTDIDLSGITADFLLCGFKQHFDSVTVATKRLEVVIGHEETKRFPLGRQLGTLVLRSADGKIKHVDTQIEFFVTNKTGFPMFCGDEQIKTRFGLKIKWNDIRDTPTTLAGYGITDAVKSVNGKSPDENGNVEVETGGGGTTDYNNLENKPSINAVTLSGNKTAAELGLQTQLTSQQLFNIEAVPNKANRTELCSAWAANTAYTTTSFAIHDNAIYRCTTAHTSGSAWDSSKWILATIADILALYLPLAGGGEIIGNLSIIGLLDITNFSQAPLRLRLGNRDSDRDLYSLELGIFDDKWQFKFTRIGEDDLTVFYLAIPFATGEIATTAFVQTAISGISVTPLSGRNFDFATTQGVMDALKATIEALGGTVTNAPTTPVQNNQIQGE